MKKGQTANIGNWILIIVGLVVVVLLFYQVKDRLFLDPLEVYDCAGEVALHKKISSLTKEEVLSDINCPTRDVLIKEDFSDEKTARTIAQEMRWCWDSWGKGEYQLFEEDGVFCHICSMVRFEDTNKEFSSLMPYLAEHTVGSSDLSYIEYFSPTHFGEVFSGEDFLASIEQQSSIPVISSSQDQAIIFYTIKGKDSLTAFSERLEATVIGAGATIVVGSIGAIVCTGTVLCAVGASFSFVVGTVVTTIANYFTDTLSPYASMMVIQPTDEESIGLLGCTHSFASR